MVKSSRHTREMWQMCLWNACSAWTYLKCVRAHMVICVCSQQKGLLQRVGKSHPVLLMLLLRASAREWEEISERTGGEQPPEKTNKQNSTAWETLNLCPSWVLSSLPQPTNTATRVLLNAASPSGMLRNVQTDRYPNWWKQKGEMGDGLKGFVGGVSMSNGQQHYKNHKQKTDLPYLCYFSLFHAKENEENTTWSTFYTVPSLIWKMWRRPSLLCTTRGQYTCIWS